MSVKQRSSSLTRRIKGMRRSGSGSHSRGESPNISESEEDDGKRSRAESKSKTNTNAKEVELHELQERVRMLEKQQALHEFQGLAAPTHGTIGDTYASGSEYTLVSGGQETPVKLGDDVGSGDVLREYGWYRRCCFYFCWST
jgi:hypothetical protein